MKVSFKRNYRYLLTLVLAIATLGVIAESKDDGTLENQHMSALIDFALSQHIKKQRLTPEVNINTLSNFVNTLDPGKIFLLSNEVTRIHSNRMKVLMAKQEGNWSFVTNIFQSVFLPNVRDSYAYAQKYLSDTNFVPNTSLKIPVDYKTLKYPVTAEERTKALEATLNYQVAFLESMGEHRTNATRKVIKRRERVLKYFSNLSTAEQFGLFLNAFCQALDPHSTYFPPADMEDFNISMSLSLEGIGATLNQEDGYTIIAELTPGSPADRCGKLKPGDKIIAVAQGEKGEFVDVVDMELRHVVKHIRGKKGTTVVLRVLRKTRKGNRTFDLPIVRDKVKLEEQGPRMQIVDIARSNGVSQVRHARIAVIELPSFYLDTESRTLTGDFDHSAASDVKKLLLACQTQNVDGVILDFQRNGGGVLDEAVNLAGLFLKRGNIVLTKDASSKIHPLNDRNNDLIYPGPLIITTSSLTASAAEIVTGALKAYQRALVVGQAQTFGKGSVQQIIPLLARLGALKITKGLYFIANGISPQFDGVKSDITVPSNLDALPVGERLLPCALNAPPVANRLSMEPTTGKGATWTPVDGSLIARLNALSKMRQGNSPKIKKITEFIEKTEKERKEGFATIASLLENKDKDLDEEDEEEIEELKDEDEDKDIDYDADNSQEALENGLTKTDRELLRMSRKQSSITNSVLIQESLQIFGDWLLPDTVK